MLKVINIVKRFDGVIASDQVSFKIGKGETYGLVGESGSGKSTIGNMIIGLLKPTSGQIIFDNKELWVNDEYRRPTSGQLQIVFQDPQSSLDSRMTIGQIITEPLRALSFSERNEKSNSTYLSNLLRRVGLHEDYLNRSPHEFSGGQRQRIAIARALISNPKFIILDEPTSALDVSVQAQILNLLKSLQEEFGLTYLFISHDMSVIEYMCDRVGVLHHGKLVEEAQTEELFNDPQQEYTKLLLSSLPKFLDRKEG